MKKVILILAMMLVLAGCAATEQATDQAVDETITNNVETGVDAADISNVSTSVEVK